MSEVHTIIHYNHDGIALGEAFPSNLEYGFFLNKPHYVTYELDNTSTLAVQTNCDPYRTDFILERVGDEIMGGIHTGVRYNEWEDHGISVSGNDWKHYLEKLFYPFDPTNPVAGLYQVAARDIALIVKDLLDTALAQSYTLPITYTLVAIGQTSNYLIEPNDTEDLLAKITTLSQLRPGFDFDISWDKVLTIYPSARGSAVNFDFTLGKNCKISPYENKGPAGTRLLGTAQGPSSSLGYAVLSGAASAYRRLDVTQDFNDVQDLTQLTQLAIAEGVRAATPEEVFTVEWLDTETDLFAHVGLGDTVPVAGNIGYKRLDGSYRVVGIVNNPTDDGLDLFKVTFDDAALSL